MRPLFRIHLLVIIFPSGFPSVLRPEVFQRVFTWSPSGGMLSSTLLCGYNTVAAEWVLIGMNTDSQNGCWIECQTHFKFGRIIFTQSCEDSVEFLYTLHPVLLWSHVFTHSSLLASSITAVLLLQLRNSPWYITIKSTPWFIQSSRVSFSLFQDVIPWLRFDGHVFLVSGQWQFLRLSLFLTVLRNSVLKNVSCSVECPKVCICYFSSYIEWGYALRRKIRDEVPLIRSTY